MILSLARGLAIALAICAAAGAADPPSDRSDAAIVLEIERLLSPDPTIADGEQQRLATLEKLRKIPLLIEALEKDFPNSRYRPAAYGMAIDALMIRRQAGDQTASAKELAGMARRLLGIADDQELRAKAEFALLDLELAALLEATTQPAAASGPSTTSAPARTLAALARKFTCLADDLPRTTYAPAALFQAAALYLEVHSDEPAIATFRRLSRDYPKDPFTLKALMILVQLHTRAGNDKEALAVKRQVVEGFSGSAAALKYRADIAKVECLGKPFFLRFRSVRGRQVNVRDYQERTVLVYFYASLVEGEFAPQVLKEMAALASLAQQRNCVLLAVGADEESRADKVAARLEAGKIDTPNLLDPDNKVAVNYGVLFVPAVAVVGPDGKLKDIVSDADIVAALRKALDGPSTQPAAASQPQ